MKKFLKLCDFYGQHFHMNIKSKPKYYTYFGGIFSILSFLSFIIIFLTLGYNDFKRNYPISNTSTIPPSGYRNIKFGEEKLYLPWRIIDYDENAINISGIIYPKIYYFTVQPDNITGQLITKYNLINYKLCNETSMKYLGKEYIIDIPIETLYCIDMEDLNVGGSWNSDFLNFIRFDLYMCEDGIDYDETNYKCTSYEKLQNVYGYGDSVFFELLYPVVQFQPTNLNIPILILYKTYYYIFNKFSNKLDRMYLQEHIFEDEQSWFFNNPINISYWGVNTINGESYIHGDKDVLRFASTSKLYTLNIYFDLGVIYYTRKYKKLYEILGEVFPIISAVWSFFSFISKIINEINMGRKLNEFIMGYDNNKEKKNLKKSTKYIKLFNNFENNKNIIKKDCNHIINKTLVINKNKNFTLKTEQNNQVIPLGNFDNTFEDSSKIFCNQNNTNINKNVQKKPPRKSKTIGIESSKVSQFNLLKLKMEKFPLYYYFFGFLYNKVSLRKKKKSKLYCISDNFYKSFYYFRHIIDITSYLTLYNEFELMKKTTFDKLNDKDSLKNDNNNKLFIPDKNKFKKRFSVNKIYNPIELI